MILVAPFLQFVLAVGPVPFATSRTSEETLELTAGEAAIRFDRRDGHVRELRFGRSVIATGGPSLWTLTLQNERTVKAESFSPTNECARFDHRFDQRAGLLELRYVSPEVEVCIVASVKDNGFELRPTVIATDSPGLQFGMMPQLVFPADRVREFTFPVGAGMSLLRPFFLRQPADPDATASWRSVPIFDRPIRQLIGSAPVMRPWLDEHVPIRLTAGARRWLGDVAIPRSAEAMVRRPPDDDEHVALLVSDNGTFLAAYPVGKGWFVRFGGMIDVSRQPWLLGVMDRLLQHFLHDKAAARVGEITFLRTVPRHDRWAASLARKGYIRWQPLDSFTHFREALSDANAWPVILNPYSELLPAASVDGWQDVLVNIQSYCEAGGVWIDAGGDYSFFRAAVPHVTLRIDVKYPGPNWQHGRFFGNTYADFVHLDSKDGQLTVYGVQPDTPDIEPYSDAAEPQRLFVPSRMSIIGGQEAGGGVVGIFQRHWQVYTPKGKAWTLPPLRLSLGRNLPQAADDYLHANRLTRSLEDKVDRRLLERWKRTVLLKYVAGGRRPDRFERFMKRLDRLPGPITLHPVDDWLYMGFDDSYPDNLLYDEKTKAFLPNPDFCTPTQWHSFYRAAQARGHLVMPYANNTWWCDDPRPPTFVAEGEEPLLRNLNGSLRPEHYGHRTGFSICPWHPVVRRVNLQQLRGLTQAYPGKLVFYDQVGARNCPYDTNPACPHPTAYAAGWINMAREHSRSAAISTEHGCDRYHNTIAQFCGTLEDRYPCWNRTFGPGRARVSPIVLMMAHDKVMITSHDLGTHVATPEQLSWYVLTGQQIIAQINVLPDQAWTKDGLKWLRWLSRVQQHVLADSIGVRLTKFRHLAEDVIEAGYAGVEVVANFGPDAYQLTDDVTVAPGGFYARSRHFMAGRLLRWQDRHEDEPFDFIIRNGRKHQR